MKASGTVNRTSAKDWKGRNGNVVLYSFTLDTGNEWYRTGEFRPPFNEGDFVEFEYESVNGGNTVNKDTIVVGKTAPATVATAPAPVVAAKAPAPKEDWNARADYWAAKEARDIEVVEPRITLSSAQRDAISVVGMALAHEAIPLGQTKGARLGIILGAIDEVAARFVAQRNGQEVPPATQKKVKAEKAEESTDGFTD